uniref:sensor histidine kinase n=1 Tax=Flavobacterium sp. TaxID=239 RepID=UPI00262E1412
VLIIVIILFIFLYKNFKNQKKLNQQQEVIHKQNIIFLESRKEVELMQAMMEGEESERKRIARDLHDGVASRLSSLLMQIEQLNSNEHGHFEYQKISSNLALAIKDLRQTAFNLIPETLSELGLDMALKDLCFLMSNATVNIHYNSNQISNDIISSQQTTIFRIVQELINNALKHADCTEVTVDCSQNNTLFLITVEDNGTGFDTKNLDSYKGLGLKNIKTRVDLLDGNMDAKYIAGVGTIFNIELKVRFTNES